MIYKITNEFTRKSYAIMTDPENFIEIANALSYLYGAENIIVKTAEIEIRWSESIEWQIFLIDNGDNLGIN